MQGQVTRGEKREMKLRENESRKDTSLPLHAEARQKQV